MAKKKIVTICGVLIPQLSKTQIMSRVNKMIYKRHFCHIVTLNPEILHKAYHNPYFAKVLNMAQIKVIDGIGIKFAFFANGVMPCKRITGIDLMWEIIDIAANNHLSIYLATNINGLSTWTDVRDVIKNKHPHLEVTGENLEPSSHKNVIIDADIILCNYGAPHQEYFLHHCKKKPSHVSARIGIGVGGAFDFMTNKITRAPKAFQYIGCEWLWRLYQQPHRCKRIITAVFIFPYTILFEKVSKKS